MTPTPPAPSKDWQQSLYQHPMVWLLALACAHIAARVLIADGMKWDESEQIIWSQQFLLGYGAQPPAYSWLQWAANQVFGPSVLSLALVKHSLIVLAYVLAWQAGRVLLPAKGAFWVAGGLLLMLPFGWDGIRDQTHTVLVTAMTFGAWWMALRQVRAPSAINFVWLGVFCGLGMLGKYSFAMLIGLFFVAAMSVPTVRRALLGRGFWLAPLVGLLIFAPHGYWLLHHWQEATTETLTKMNISTQVSHIQGLGALAKAVLATLGLWLLVVLASYRSRLWSPVYRATPSNAPDWRLWAWPLLGRYLALVFIVLIGMVLVGDVSNFRQRWVLPLTAIAPLALYAWRPALLEGDTGRGYTWGVLVFAMVFFVAASLRPWQSDLRNEPDELNHPVQQLAERLSAAGYQGQGVILGSDHMVAAMVRSRFPQATAIACNPEFAHMANCIAQARDQAAASGAGLLVIARMDKAAPDWWDTVFATIPAVPLQSLSIPFVHMRASTPPMRYQYLWLPASAAATQQP